MATKQRRVAKVDASNPSAKLIAALQFVAMAQTKTGPPESQYCTIRNNWIAASNGILTIGTKIEEDLDACPHTLQFIEALRNAVDSDQVIAQENEGLLTVRAGAFRAAVPCADPLRLVPPPAPDVRAATVDSRLRVALDAVQFLAVDENADAYKASILIQANSCVATDGGMLLEYWHGIDLPPNIMIPKRAAQAIVKCKKELSAFGFTDSSATFYFTDDSFIKTQLYAGQFPNFARLYDNNPANATPLPEGFFRAVHTIAQFSENGHIFFDNGNVQSEVEETNASTFVIEGLVEEMGFQAKYLLDAQMYMNVAEFDAERGKVFFFGSNCRGIIMGLNNFAKRREAREADRIAREEQKRHNALNPRRVIEPRTTGFDDMDDDIPF